MPEISKVQLPSGGVYDIKDATARQMISGGVSFIIAWNGTSMPVPGNIPAGIKVTYGGVEYTGTLTADSAQVGAFYLVSSSTSTTGSPNDIYDEYVPIGPTGSKTWEKIGDTQVDLTDVVTGVTLNKQTDVVLGESTTFALTSGSVTHGSLSGHTDTVLGTGTTFNVTNPTISLGGTTKYLSATASGGGAAWNSKDQKTVVTGYASPATDTFVKSVTAETNKNLVTTTVPNVTENTSVSIPNVTGNTSVTIPNVTGNTSVTIPNVTSVGSASTWSFTMGTGADSETLIIGGDNSVAPTLGTALSASKVTLGNALTATNTTLGTALSASKVTLGTAITVATGATSTTGTGDAVVTGVTVGDSATAITGLGTPSTANVIGSSSTFTNTQPSVSLSANAEAATGRITYLESASPTASGGAVSAVTSGTGSDAVTAIISMPTSTVGTGITVGTNDKVTALTNSTTLTVTKGNQ